MERGSIPSAKVERKRCSLEHLGTMGPYEFRIFRRGLVLHSQTKINLLKTWIILNGVSGRRCQRSVLQCHHWRLRPQQPSGAHPVFYFSLSLRREACQYTKCWWACSNVWRISLTGAKIELGEGQGFQENYSILWGSLLPAWSPTIFVPLRLGVVCMAAGRAPTAGPWGARPRCWQTLGKDLNCNSGSPCGLGRLGNLSTMLSGTCHQCISESRPFPTLRRSKLVAGSQDSPSFSRGVCVANTESAYIILHHSFESHLVIRIGGIPSIHNWPGYFFGEPSNCFQGMTSSKFGLTAETTAMNFKTSSDIPEWIQMAQKCKTGGLTMVFLHISTKAPAVDGRRPYWWWAPCAPQVELTGGPRRGFNDGELVMYWLCTGYMTQV